MTEKNRSPQTKNDRSVVASLEFVIGLCPTEKQMMMNDSIMQKKGKWETGQTLKKYAVKVTIRKLEWLPHVAGLDFQGIGWRVSSPFGILEPYTHY